MNVLPQGDVALEETAVAATAAETEIPEEASEMKEAAEEAASPEVTDVAEQGIDPAASLALPLQSRARSRLRTCVCF